MIANTNFLLVELLQLVIDADTVSSSDGAKKREIIVLACRLCEEVSTLEVT